MNSVRLGRVFYCGMVNTKAYEFRVGEPIHIAAGSNKMVSIVRALRNVDRKGYLVSMPVLGRKCRARFVAGCLLRGEGIPQLFFPTVANAYLRKVFSFFCFAWFCVRTVKFEDKVILYNHSFESLFGVLLLFLRNNRAILDIEDAPCQTEMGLRVWFESHIFSIISRLSRGGKIIVSRMLADRLGLDNFCIVYGAVCFRDLDLSHKLDRPDGPLRILYGGALLPGTGVELFCNSVQLLANTLPRDSSQIEFIVTGFGAANEILSLRENTRDSAITVTYQPDLPIDSYRDQLRMCDASLCLKMPDAEISQTTFPSKVVEITANGLLLISTRASDVPILFDSSSAMLLSDSSPRALVDAIMSMLADRRAMRIVAKNGQVRALDLFESRSVGQRIQAFLMTMSDQ